eukprot:scaffold61313_cov33-Phaeocystis_antarctica.AAC.1
MQARPAWRAGYAGRAAAGTSAAAAALVQGKRDADVRDSRRGAHPCRKQARCGRPEPPKRLMAEGGRRLEQPEA